ncbi:MAG: DUF3782 domain-containing protein, partial [Sulfolobales archaeon]
MSELLSKEEKERILRTLEKDMEFRYAVAGLVGLAEVLKRLDSIEARLEEHSRILREHSEALQNHSKILEELIRGVEDLAKAVDEHSRRVEDLTKAVYEHSKTIAELKISIGSLGRRIGLDLEKTILNLYRDQLLGLGIRDVNEIERFVYKDKEGKYFRKGAKIEVDIYAHDKEVYLIEVKSLVEEEDVDFFDKKCEIIAQAINKEIKRKIIVAVNVTEDALRRA